MPRQNPGTGTSRSGPLRPKRSDSSSRLPPFIQPGNKGQSPSPELATPLPVGGERGHFQVGHGQSRKEGHRRLSLRWMGTPGVGECWELWVWGADPSSFPRSGRKWGGLGWGLWGLGLLIQGVLECQPHPGRLAPFGVLPLSELRQCLLQVSKTR